MEKCWKRRFSSKVGAQRAISELLLTRRGREKNNDRYDGARLEPYACQTCGGVHIGHRHYASKRRRTTTDKENE